MVDLVNATSDDTLTSEQRDDQLAANSTAARNFIEDMDLSVINQEHIASTLGFINGDLVV